MTVLGSQLQNKWNTCIQVVLIELVAFQQKDAGQEETHSKNKQTSLKQWPKSVLEDKWHL